MLNAALQKQAKRFVTDIPPESALLVIEDALKVPALVAVAHSRIDDITDEDLAELLQTDPSPEVVDGAVRRFSAADSFREALVRGRTLLIPAAPMLTFDQVRVTLRAFVDNGQINGSTGMLGIMNTFLEQTRSHANAVIPEWNAVHELLSKPIFQPRGERLKQKIGDQILLLSARD